MATIQQYPIHPIASIFPEMTPAEKRDLKADILANGVQVPATLFNGEIADGRSRYEAWSELIAEGSPVHDEFPVMDFPEDEEHLLRFVISMNRHRRHLNAGQRAGIAAQAARYAAKWRKGDAESGKQGSNGEHTQNGEHTKNGNGRAKPKGRPKAESNGATNGEATGAEAKPARRGRPPKLAEANSAIAAAAGVSESYMADAVKIGEQDPDMLSQVAAGSVTLPEAKRRLSKQASANSANEKPASEHPPGEKPAGGKRAKPDTESTSSEPAVPMDEVGEVLPPRLIPVFEDGKRLAEADKLLSQARKIVKEIGESAAGAYLPLDRIVAEINNAKQGIKHSKPYAVCASCKGKGCAKCKSKCGYVTKAVYERIDGE